MIWVTIEGGNSAYAEHTHQALGGIARFDSSAKTFEVDPQQRNKRAGGVGLGVRENSV